MDDDRCCFCDRMTSGWVLREHIVCYRCFERYFETPEHIPIEQFPRYWKALKKRQKKNSLDKQIIFDKT